MGIRGSDKPLFETDIRSRRARIIAVRGEAADSRNWLRSAPLCPLLGQFQIVHVGVGQMPHPFLIVRTKLGGSYFLACFGGSGEVLVDGRWKTCRSGRAFLLPPGTLQAFHTRAGKSWDFCWVRYRERPGQKPLATATSPVLAKFDAEPLRHAILGLHGECTATATPAAIGQWVRLIHGYVQAFARPAAMDDRLWRLWEQVAGDLERPWTIAEMAKRTHLSEKQFQRLCLRDLGRNPRQQLIWLRMRRAAELIAEGDLKIAAVAHAVGYQNPFMFSTAFKRTMGWRPSEYPGKSGGRRS